MSSSAGTKNEGTGVVTSDSLAAESLAEGGSFGSNGETKTVAPKQPSSSTTDTSAAQTLPPAENASARPSTDDALKYKATRGTGTVGAATTSMKESRPKGSNLSEGGFDSDVRNASINADIGGKNDPSRKAVLDMQSGNAGGSGGKDKVMSNDGQYDVLGDTSA